MNAWFAELAPTYGSPLGLPRAGARRGARHFRPASGGGTISCRKAATAKPLLQSLEGGERATTCLGQIDDGGGVGFAQLHPNLGKNVRRGVPGVVQPLIRERSDLGDPAAHVRAAGIEAFALCHRIEDAEIGCGVQAGAGDPLPVPGIVRDVAIDEAVPEPGLTLAPVDQQVLRKERATSMRTRLCM